jgi:hypothetical protein
MHDVLRISLKSAGGKIVVPVGLEASATFCLWQGVGVKHQPQCGKIKAF